MKGKEPKMTLKYERITSYKEVCEFCTEIGKENVQQIIVDNLHIYIVFFWVN